MNSMSFFFGNGLFQFWHVLYLLISVAIIVTGSLLAIKKNLKLETMQKICMFTGLITEAMKMMTYIVINEKNYHGYLPKTDLPFNLCSIQVILFIILVVSKNEKVKRALRGFMLPTCLIGGSAALLLATSSSLQYPTITIQYFGFHCAIIIFAIYMLASKEVEFTVKDYGRTIIMLIATLFIAIYLNSILVIPEYSIVDGVIVANYPGKINYMYVVNGPKDNLPYLNESHGWIVYIVHYAILCIFAVTLCYIKPIITSIKSKRKPSN